MRKVARFTKKVDPKALGFIGHFVQSSLLLIGLELTDHIFLNLEFTECEGNNFLEFEKVQNHIGET